MNFTKEEVILNYQNLAQSPDPEIRKQSNQYLLQFQRSAQAWQISQEIIFIPSALELNLLGCQILYQKVRSEFALLSQLQLNEIKSFVFNILENYQIQLSMPIYRQLCSCVGVVILVTINNSWQNAIDDIIIFMQQNPRSLILGLEILESAARDITNIIVEQKTLSKIKKSLNSQSSKIFQIFSSLLVISDRNLVKKCLESLIEWTSGNVKLQILEDQQIIRNILNCSGDQEFLEIISEIFENTFTYSDGSNILEMRSLYPNKNIGENEAMNLMQIFNSIKLMLNQIQVHDQKNNIQSKLVAQILTNFCSKYMIFILEKNEISLELLRMLLIISQHNCLKVASIPLDFWCSFNQQASQYILQQEYKYIIEAYQTLFTIVLEKCKFPSPDQKIKDLEEPISQNDISLNEYRETAKDMFLQILIALKSQGAELGLNSFFQIIYTLFDRSQCNEIQYLINVELGLFCVNSVADDDSIFMKSNQYIQHIYEYICSDQFPSQSIFCVKESLQFMYTLCYELKNNPILLDKCIKYIFQFIMNNDLQTVSAMAFHSIIQIIADHQQLLTFQHTVEQFVKVLNYKFENITVLENLVQGVFIFAIKLVQFQHKQQAFQTLFELLQINLITFQQKLQTQTIEIYEFTNILCILNSLMSGFEAHSVATIDYVDSLMKGFIKINIGFINQLFKQFGSKDLKTFVSIYQKIIKILRLELGGSFVDFLTDSLVYLQQDIKTNSFCLKILQSLLDITKPPKPELDQWLGNNFQAFNVFLIQSIQSLKMDPELIKEYIVVLGKVNEYNPIFFIDLDLFQETMDFVLYNCLLQVREYQMTREICLYLMSLAKQTLKKQFKNSQKFINLIPKILNVTILCVCDIEKTLIHYISHVLIIICGNYPDQREYFINCLGAALNDTKYDILVESYKDLLKKGLVDIAIKGTLKDLKLSLSDLSAGVNKAISLQDAEYSLNCRLNLDEKNPIIF